MNLASEIKSRFQKAEILSEAKDPETVEVSFPKAKEIVSVTNQNDRYSATYPKLVKDGRGRWKEEIGYSDDMLIQGALWILNQVHTNGRVEPEIID